MRTFAIAIAAVLFAGACRRVAQQKSQADPAKVDAAIKAAFPTAPADWQTRLEQDDTMKQCSQHDNLPPKEVAETIQTRERATIEYPADGKLVGRLEVGRAARAVGLWLALHRLSRPPARTAAIATPAIN